MNARQMMVGAVALMAAASLPPAAVSEEPPAKVLTWDDCVRLALAQNPDLGSSRYAKDASVASYRGSWNGLMPNLTLSNSHNDNNTNTAASNKWSAQASANINLFSASSIASIKSASASLLQAQANLRQTSSSLRFNLRQAFAQMIFAQKNFEVAQHIKDMRDKDSQLVALRYESGRESKGNMLRAAAQLLQAEADLSSARRNLVTSRKGLDRQLGLDDFQVVAATGTLNAAPAPDSVGNEAVLLAQRPDVAVQQALVKSAEASVNAARSPVWPTLTGNYTRSRSSTYEFPATLYGWTGGFTLSIPLFGGGPTSVYYAVSGAKRNLDKARQDLRTVRDAAVVDLETVWASYAAAVDAVAVQHALLEAARQRNDEADVRYASGLLTFDNWEIIATDRIGTEKQAISSEFNAVVAQASWEKSIGKELGE